MRCPSEVLSLRWQDVDWERGRIAVQSPKGERHGKAVRSLPLFPEVRPYLEEAFSLATPGTVYVIHHNRKPEEKRVDGRSCNYRTRFEKIVRRAGLTPWPRIFHNLRASRETERMSTSDTVPEHAALSIRSYPPRALQTVLAMNWTITRLGSR